ncbi:LysR family transcriptional regulator [Tateyamaria omphalii]|uniref:LysR family transcriptional regulator n=1 Tax=Tateyamaria omphalii TaxID=299262 RepID=UPI001C99C6A3|nr:LysR family transcriptional regulator [Tateyamaria omphalii]MBY5931449.1 LysR family transcriptional regulator [Tateyamaria omphalii]
MNWNSISFDWNQARAFLAVAEERSLSAAAAVLGVTQPTITRQIAALEKNLEVILFERSGRSVSLTPTGLNLLDHVRTMADGANMMSLAASGQSQTIEGLVRISATDMTAAYVLPPMLDQLQLVAPNLELDIVADNNVSDLLLRQADIAIRHARPEEPDLLAKLVCEDPARFFVVSKYTDSYGEPKLDEDLSQHQFVSFGDAEGMLAHFQTLGLKLTRQNFRYVSRSQVVELEIARQGHCIAIMTDRIAARFPEFGPVLTDIEPFKIPNWLVAHRELHTSRRIRLAFDLLKECLSQ